MAIGETPSAEVASARDLSGYVSLQEARKNLLLSLFFCVSATRSETDCGKQARIWAYGRQSLPYRIVKGLPVNQQ